MEIPKNVTELLQALVRIPSVNPQGDPGVDDAGERACAEFVGAFLRECGAEIAVSEVLPNRPNVIGKFPTHAAKNSANGELGERKPRLIFAPHLDTVSVVGMTINPFGAELRDEKLFGRGASDTKGPMAAMLWALYEMREQIAALPHEIWFAGLMGEEAGQDGAKHFVADYVAKNPANHQLDFAVIGEPTDLQIVHTHKGALWLSLTAKGRAVHASAPERGENAIYKMADVIRCIREEIAPELAAMRDPALGSPTISVGTIRGGSKINIVADHCAAEIDIRTIPANGDLFEFIAQKLRAVCPDLEIECRESRPLFTAPDHPCIRALEAAGAGCAGAPWFCDAAIFSEAGIPAVAAGPGSIAQAHTEDEWIAVSELERGVEFYKNFLAALR